MFSKFFLKNMSKGGRSLVTNLGNHLTVSLAILMGSWMFENSCYAGSSDLKYLLI